MTEGPSGTQEPPISAENASGIESPLSLDETVIMIVDYLTPERVANDRLAEQMNDYQAKLQSPENNNTLSDINQAIIDCRKSSLRIKPAYYGALVRERDRLLTEETK